MLSARQEQFAINIFKGMTQRDAYMDAYHPKSTMAVIDVNASQLLRSPKISNRLKELMGKVTTEAVSTVQERKEKLSQIANGVLRTPTTPKEAIMAITELNKMEKVYDTNPQILVDSRTINVIVENEEAKKLTESIKNYGIWDGR